jgi:hypothetical protein
MPPTRTTLPLIALCLLVAGCGTDRATGPAGAVDFARVSSAALQAMQEQAESIKAHGAALVAWVPGEATTGWESRMRVVGGFHSNDADPANNANLLAIAYTKAAEMADTLKNSGSGVRPKLKGENGYKGGVILPAAGGYVIAAFSGAKSEDDVVISGKGAEVLVAAYGAPAK